MSERSLKDKDLREFYKTHREAGGFVLVQRYDEDGFLIDTGVFSTADKAKEWIDEVEDALIQPIFVDHPEFGKHILN